jgi:hypothetical protein
MQAGLGLEAGASEDPVGLVAPTAILLLVEGRPVIHRPIMSWGGCRSVSVGIGC